eukprot:1024033-Rhodomonas_salina.1
MVIQDGFVSQVNLPPATPAATERAQHLQNHTQDKVLSRIGQEPWLLGENSPVCSLLRPREQPVVPEPVSTYLNRHHHHPQPTALEQLRSDLILPEPPERNSQRKRSADVAELRPAEGDLEVPDSDSEWAAVTERVKALQSEYLLTRRVTRQIRTQNNLDDANTEIRKLCEEKLQKKLQELVGVENVEPVQVRLVDAP